MSSQPLRSIVSCAPLLGSILLTACGGGSSSLGNSSPAVPASITTQPANQIVSVGQTATFTAVATGTAPLMYQWQKNATNISGATSASYTTPATTVSDNGAKFDVTVSNSTSAVTSNVASLAVNFSTSPSPSASSNVDVTTYHYDNLRSGQNVNETTLKTANVTQAKFGLVGSFAVDGRVDAQPLYLSNVAIPNVGNKNVLYVVTEHDSVYAPLFEILFFGVGHWFGKCH